ncbi:MAG: phytoene desaturase family protein, partial [Cetobacterium sp.]
MKKGDVIIVGAGPGGLAAGLLLSNKGYSVKIFEKKSYVGGRNSSFKLGEYKFDLGPTFFLMPGVLRDIFIEVGERIDDHLNLIEINPMYRLKFYGSDDFNPYSHNKKNCMYGELEKTFPYSSKDYDRYMEREEKKFSRLEPCLKVPYLSPFDYLKPRFLKSLPYLDAFKSIYNVLGDFFKYEELKLSFTFQAKYIGMSPWIA